MDKLNALAMFVATAETGSFSRGAERLGKTPSALTKAVAHLEAELGARLFERTTRSLALTEAGQIYLEAARQSLETLRTAGQEIELLESELRGELRLAAPPSFAAAFLQQACASFLEAHPRISLRVDLDETFLDLSEGGYDLGLRDGPIDLPGLVARPLAPNQIVLCASPAYLARQPAPQGPKDFERHAWLVFQHPSLNQNFWWMERDGARQRIDQPRPRLASDNYDFLLAHLLAGLGLQFCPQWSVAPLLGEGRLVRLLGDYHFDPGPFGPSIHVLYPGTGATRGRSARSSSTCAPACSDRGCAIGCNASGTSGTNSFRLPEKPLLSGVCALVRKMSGGSVTKAFHGGPVRVSPAPGHAPWRQGRGRLAPCLLRAAAEQSPVPTGRPADNEDPA